MKWVSLKSGTRRMMHGSRVSNVAARIGRAEFFDPLILIEPESEWPPWIRILSISPKEESCHTAIIAYDSDVVIIFSGKEHTEILGLADPDFEREHSAGTQVRTRDADQLPHQ